MAASQTLQANDTWSFTDDAGRTVEVPFNPERIVSLHDIGFTIPLIELGIHPVGSHGRTTIDGMPFIRASKGLTGIDFDNSDIEFMGNLPADIERVAAISPGLIITSPWQLAPIEQLERIAPTVVLDNSERERCEIYGLLAEVVGATDQLAIMETRYQGQLEEIRRLIDTGNITVNVIQGVNGEVLSWHTYATLGKVLRDAGFQFPDRINAIPEGDFARFSGEALPEVDADFLFVTYRTDAEETPADAIAHLEEVAPNFCDYLYACRNNQMVVMPREKASSASYYELGIMAYTVISLGFDPAGVTQDSNPLPILDEKTLNTPRIGSRASPDIEAIAALDPDIILSDLTRNEQINGQLTSIAPTLVFNSLRGDYEALLEQFVLIGGILGEVEFAERLVAEHRQAFASAIDASQANGASLVAGVAHPGGFSVHTKDSFAGSLLAQLGWNNPVKPEGNATNYALSLEGLVSLNPEVLVIFQYEREREQTPIHEWQQSRIWQQLTAVQNNQVYVFDRDNWTRARGLMALDAVLTDLADSGLLYGKPPTEDYVLGH